MTDSRVAQDGKTPLHFSADKTGDGLIKALVAAKADVDAKDKVRGGVLGGRGEDGVGSACYYCCLGF